MIKNIKKQLNRLFQMQNTLLQIFKLDIKSNIDLKIACREQINKQYTTYLNFRDFLKENKINQDLINYEQKIREFTD